MQDPGSTTSRWLADTDKAGIIDGMSSPGPGHESGLRDRLAEALRAALGAREAVAIAALRTALSAIANAEAVTADAVPAPGSTSPYVAGASAGPGSAEAPRRALSDADVAAIVKAEIAERQTAARQYSDAGRRERADRIAAEASVLSAVLAARPTAPE